MAVGFNLGNADDESYCSHECQRDRWQSHRTKCKRLAKMKKTMQLVDPYSGDSLTLEDMT